MCENMWLHKVFSMASLSQNQPIDTSFFSRGSMVVIIGQHMLYATRF